MEKTFDWILQCRHDAQTKEKICNALACKVETEIQTEIHRLCFFPKAQYLKIFSKSENSLFCSKIIPTQISYATAQKMIQGDWDGIEKNEIVRLKEE